MSRNVLILIAVLGVPISVAAWVRFVHDPQVRLEAAVAVSRDSLDRARAAYTALKAERDHLDSALAKRDVKLRIRVDTIQVKVAAARTELEKELPDTLLPKFLALEVWRDSVDAAKDLTVTDYETRLALRDTTIADLTAQLREAIRQRDLYQRLAHPGFFAGFLKAIPQVASGIALGVVVGEGAHITLTGRP